MSVFDFLKKKKEIDEPDDDRLGRISELGHSRPPDLQQASDTSSRPFGEGITEPPVSQEHFSPNLSRPLEKIPSLISEQPQAISQNDSQLILAKLETIKAQLDFLQQKFEKLEQRFLKEEQNIKWR